MSATASSIRVTLVRFAVLFLTALVIWSVVLYIGRGVIAFGMGCAIADILACLGVFASQSLDAVRLRRPIVLTPSQEFEAVRIPLYLVVPPPAMHTPEPWAAIPATPVLDSDARDVPPMPFPYRTSPRYAS